MSIRKIALAAAGNAAPYGAMPFAPVSLTYGNGMFYAINSAYYSTSTDGLVWSAQVELPSDNVHYGWAVTTFGNGHFSLVRLISTPAATHSAASSTDGVNWTLGSATAGNYNGLVYGGGIFLAWAGQVGGGLLTKSTDNGTSYTTVNTNTTCNDMTYGNGVFVAVKSALAYVTPNATVSPAFSALPSYAMPTGVWNCVAFGAYSDTGTGIFLAIATPSSGSCALAISTNGTAWTVLSTVLGVSFTYSRMAYGNGRFVAMQRATVATNVVVLQVASDGSVAFSYPSIVSNKPYAIAFGSNSFVMVGQTPSISQIISVS